MLRRLFPCLQSVLAWLALGLAASLAAPPAEELPPDLSQRPHGADWPAFLGPTGDSRSSERGLALPWPAAGPPIEWQLRTGTTYAMPAVSRGRLFLFARHGPLARLDCLHSETGAPLWKFEYATDYEDPYGYDNGPRVAPVVDGGRVYVLGPEGVLHCLRVVDGGLEWKLDTRAAYGFVPNFFGVGSAPVVEGDLLIMQVGGSSAEYRDLTSSDLDRVEPNGTGVVAFDKRTGVERYRVGQELASYASPTVATVAGRRMAFVFARGGLLAFEPTTGKPDFHFPWRASLLESVNASNPVVVNDHVLISETYGPGAALLRVTPGRTPGYKVVWSDELARREKRLQTHWNTPIHEAGHVYGSSGRHPQNALLRCLDLWSGEVRWSEPGLGRSSLLFVDGHFICLTEDGELIVFRANPERFEVVSRVVLKSPGAGAARAGEGARLLAFPAWAAPILARGLLYAKGRDTLVCLEVIPRP
jgi:outer membrane protein assembly factor BamB